MKRHSGVLLSITSLPSKYGIGCFDKAAYDFVDWLEKAGQKYWQILPLGATSHSGAFDSPYQAYSAFAGNPYFISLDALVEEGVLTQGECDAVDFGSNPEKVDYDLLFKNRLPLLHKAYERSAIYANKDFQDFVPVRSSKRGRPSTMRRRENCFKAQVISAYFSAVSVATKSRAFPVGRMATRQVLEGASSFPL